MNEAVFRTILHRIKGVPDNQVQSRTPASLSAETMAAQVLAEYEPSEAERIVKVWRTLGTPLNPNTVKRHLEALRRWQSQWHDNG